MESEPTPVALSGTIFDARITNSQDKNKVASEEHSEGETTESDPELDALTTASNEQPHTVTDRKKKRVSSKTRPVKAGLKRVPRAGIKRAQTAGRKRGRPAGNKRAQTTKRTEPTHDNANDSPRVQKKDTVDDSDKEEVCERSKAPTSNDVAEVATVAQRRQRRKSQKPKMYSPGKFAEKKKRAKLDHDDVYVILCVYNLDECSNDWIYLNMQSGGFKNAC